MPEFSRTVICAGGETSSLAFYEGLALQDSYLVAVDRGLDLVFRLGLTPDLYVGDGDSVAEGSVERLEPSHTRIVHLPEHKDVSDLEAALVLLVKMGRSGDLILLAALGGRVDHLLFNVCLTARHVADFESIVMLDEYELVRPIAGVCDLQLAPGTVVSFLPVAGEVRLTLRGFAYPLENVRIRRGSTLTLSNVVCEAVQHVDVVNGTVVMMASAQPAPVVS
jgi:thiamine pyrophosphokinase